MFFRYLWTRNLDESGDYISPFFNLLPLWTFSVFQLSGCLRVVVRNKLEYWINMSFFKEYQMIIVKNLVIYHLYCCWKKGQIFIYMNLKFVYEERFSLTIKIIVLAIVILWIDFVDDVFCDLQCRWCHISYQNALMIGIWLHLQKLISNRL